MNYETWKKDYKRTEDFTSRICGERFEQLLSKYFDEKSFAFYLMGQQNFIPCYLAHGLLFYKNGNYTSLYKAVKKSLEDRYGKENIDYIEGGSDAEGQYMLFFAEKEAVEVYMKEKKARMKKDTNCALERFYQREKAKEEKSYE